MAFPTVEEVLTQGFSSATTSHEVDMPSSVSSDDLLIIIFAIDKDEVPFSTPTGWTILQEDNRGGNASVAIFYKSASGSEGGTSVDIITGFANQAAAQVYHITGWNGTSGIEAGSTQKNVGDRPNPPSLSPSWGAKDTLWIAGYGCANDDGTLSSFPSAYSNSFDIVSGGGTNNGASVATARRENNTSTENPGEFNISESQAYITVCIGVEPGSSGGGGGGGGLSIPVAMRSYRNMRAI